MISQIQSIEINKLMPHPDNPNRMSKSTFAKLVRNIERTGRYEPLVVRPMPRCDSRQGRKSHLRKQGSRKNDVDSCSSLSPALMRGRNNTKDLPSDRTSESRATGHKSRKKAPGAFFQIINGHHRFEALKQLGYERCDCVIWDVDDDEAHLLLATLNRLCGNDVLEKKLDLLKKLSARRSIKELAKLTPYSGPQIQRLVSLLQTKLPRQSKAEPLAHPLVFFLNKSQKVTVEKALALARPENNSSTSAQKNAKAITEIARSYIKMNE